MRKRICRQIVSNRRRREAKVRKENARCRPRVRAITIDDVAAIPVRQRVYLNVQVTGGIDLDRLATESKGGRRVGGVAELEALEPGEARQLADVERAAADQLQNIR